MAAIRLGEISKVSRTDLKPYCFEVETKDKTYYLSLKNDEELYNWMQDIYERSPLMGVSNPTNFVHQVHVGFDPVSGAFTGLPEQWTRLLTSSAITKEDYAKNPQAVLDVLEFYTDIQKKERDEFGLGTPNMGMTERVGPVVTPPISSSASVQSASATRFGAGTGLAGQRSDSLAPSRPAPSPSAGSNGKYDNLVPSRPAPSPVPRSDADAASRQNGSASGSTRALAPSQSRPNLAPQRTAPAGPSSSKSSNDLKAGSGPGLKPLNLASAASSNVSLSSQRNVPASENASKGPSPPPQGQKPLALGQPRTNGQSSAATKPSPKPPTTALPPAPASAPQNKNLQAVKKQEGGKDRRISNMTEAQIMAKLRSVVSKDDPNHLYAKIKKVGQGASGSVYVAKTLAGGSKVAIKQMDLKVQPRKELIVNEILVMKESQHPNIVNFLNSFIVQEDQLWVVMEYMEGGALTDVIDNNTIEEDQIASICFEVRLRPTMSETFADRLLDRRRARACSICISSTSSTATSSPTTSFSTRKATSN